jgi:hypothetical protein
MSAIVLCLMEIQDKLKYYSRDTTTLLRNVYIYLNKNFRKQCNT